MTEMKERRFFSLIIKGVGWMFAVSLSSVTSMCLNGKAILFIGFAVRCDCNLPSILLVSPSQVKDCENVVFDLDKDCTHLLMVVPVFSKYLGVVSRNADMV